MFALPVTIPHYYALGDSMTYGIGSSDPATWSFPAQLAHKNHYALTDLGIPGINAHGMLADEVPAVRSDAALVTIWIGVNDVYPIAEGDESLFTVVGYIGKAVVAVHRQAPNARVVVLTPIDATLISPAAPSYPKTPHLLTETHLVTEAIDRNFEAWRAPWYRVCDVGHDQGYYANPRDFYTDDFHPADLGSQHIANDVAVCLSHGGTK